MKACKSKGVRWAIFSDLYGVWFPNVKHAWYEKSPGKVSETEFTKLILDFDEKLEKYDEIWFYHSPTRFHSLYRRLRTESRLREKVRKFTHISEIQTA